ncbi:hypothetical protein E4631_06080 [Hymenobacter sp. UV11]|uniref:hypothetical protein n=1 Tax=Hymenobacter sp. UV11 TaxID=1849735 RepID=UPI00105CCFFA|nr:hypothetical protein [Hymenobacter sp. UV11]TFZ67545.1 hypothetical protein E4631_06080 [Hymenobacter sp. UV11]
MKTVSFFISIIFLFLPAFTYAQFPVIDLRDDVNASKNWVGFAVRDNTTSGHAFVILGRENEKSAMTEIAIQGFYPNGNIVSSPGEVKSDFEGLKYVRSADQIYFIVNDNDYTTAHQLLVTWEYNPPKYNVFTNNCIDLVQKVTKSIGIDLPSRGLLSIRPSGYLNKVKEQLNSNEGLSYYKTNSRIKKFPKGSYRGALNNGMPNGLGTLVSENSVYKGQFKNGKYDGEGKLSTGSDTYSGHFKDGIPDGQGNLVNKSRAYVGYFKNGAFDGKGELENKENGSKISGTFKNGKIDGKVTIARNKGNETTTFETKDGKQVTPTNTKYKDGSKKVTQINDKGEPISSKYDGSDGTKISMNFQDGRPSSADYKFPDGSEINLQKYYEAATDSAYGTAKGNNYTYVGDFKYLVFSGKGELNVSGTQMKGDFKKGRIDGAIEHVHRNEYTFDGKIWYDDKYSYQSGNMTLANGDTYQGELRNFLFHGKGTYVHDEHCGNWGNCNSYTLTDISWVDGKTNFRPLITPASSAFLDNSWYKTSLPDYSMFDAPLFVLIGVPTEYPTFNSQKGQWNWNIKFPILILP